MKALAPGKGEAAARQFATNRAASRTGGGRISLGDIGRRTSGVRQLNGKRDLPVRLETRVAARWTKASTTSRPELGSARFPRINRKRMFYLRCERCTAGCSTING